MLTILLVAFSVGLDNFGAAVAIGVTGVDRSLRLRVALIFGFFEGAMPVVGLVAGHSVSHDLGGSAHVFGGLLLALVGLYTIVSSLVMRGPRPATTSTRRLLLLGLALSIDNAVIGFALGAKPVNLVGAVVTITIVSVALSLLGLELGRTLGARLGERAELVGGALLVGVGVAVAGGVL